MVSRFTNRDAYRSLVAASGLCTIRSLATGAPDINCERAGKLAAEEGAVLSN